MYKLGRVIINFTKLLEEKYPDMGHKRIRHRIVDLIQFREGTYLVIKNGSKKYTLYVLERDLAVEMLGNM